MSLQEVDLQAVEDAIEVIGELGFDVETVDDVEYDGGLHFQLAIRATTRHGPAAIVEDTTGDGAEDEDVQEAVGEAEQEPQDEADEPAADPDVDESEVCADEITSDVEETSVTDEDASDAPDDAEPDDGQGVPDEYGVFTAKGYGLVLSGVQEHFNSERVTVIDRPYGAVIVPGVEEDGPDYSVGAGKIQLGKPGREAIGIDVDDEVRATPDGDAVRLEPTDADPDGDDGEETEEGDGGSVEVDGENDPTPDSDEASEDSPDASSGPESEDRDDELPGSPDTDQNGYPDLDDREELWAEMAEWIIDRIPDVDGGTLVVGADEVSEEFGVDTGSNDPSRVIRRAKGIDTVERRYAEGGETKRWVLSRDPDVPAPEAAVLGGEDWSDKEYDESRDEVEAAAEDADALPELAEALEVSSEKALRLIGVYELEHLIFGPDDNRQETAEVAD